MTFSCFTLKISVQLDYNDDFRFNVLFTTYCFEKNFYSNKIYHFGNITVTETMILKQDILNFDFIALLYY